MPSFVKSVRARARASTGLPKKRRGSRRSRCTRISADVRVSAALIASLIASKSGSPRNRRVHLGRFAMALPAPACATATRLAPTTRETPAPPLPAPPAPPKDRTPRGPPAAPPRGGASTPAPRPGGRPPPPEGLEPGGVAPASEARRDDLADDPAGRCVGHDRLEPVTDLEAQLPILDEDHEEDAVVEPRLAEPPLLEEPVGDILDALALERAEDRDRHLGTRGALVVGELRLEPPTLADRQDPRIVVDASAGSGGQDEGDGDECRKKQARTSPWARWLRPPWPRRRPWAGSLPWTRPQSRGTGAGVCCSRAPPR